FNAPFRSGHQLSPKCTEHETSPFQHIDPYGGLADLSVIEPAEKPTYHCCLRGQGDPWHYSAVLCNCACAHSLYPKTSLVAGPTNAYSTVSGGTRLCVHLRICLIAALGCADAAAGCRVFGNRILAGGGPVLPTAGTVCGTDRSHTAGSSLFDG